VPSGQSLAVPVNEWVHGAQVDPAGPVAHPRVGGLSPGLPSLTFCTLARSPPEETAMSIQVVNMVPQSLSGDTNFDSEPSVTVDPSDPQRIVGTAFRPDTAAGSTTGPYFFSADGGATWALNSVIPGGTSTFGQKDISVRLRQGRFGDRAHPS